MNMFQAFVILAMPVLIGLVGAGVLLMIKIRRRRDATKTQTLDGPVPADPLSYADADRMWKRYWTVSGSVVALLAIIGISLNAASS